MYTNFNPYKYPLMIKTESNPNRRATNEDINISEKPHISFQIHKRFNQIIYDINWVIIVIVIFSIKICSGGIYTPYFSIIKWLRQPANILFYDFQLKINSK